MLWIPILLLLFYVYFTVISFFRMDFKEHPKSSLGEVVGSCVGLVLSIICLTVNAIPNIPDYIYSPLFSISFSVMFPIYAVLILCTAIKYKEQILKNVTLDKTTKILSFIFAGSGIILSIILGRLV